MAVFNKVILVGRLTRDPESRAFANGGLVAKVGMAVNNRKKNSQTGQWEDDPMFIDVEAFNRGEFGKLADMVLQRCHKGSQILVEGKLHLEQWNDQQSGQKRSKHKIVADAIQFLDPAPPQHGVDEGGQYAPQQQQPQQYPQNGNGGGGYQEYGEPQYDQQPQQYQQPQQRPQTQNQRPPQQQYPQGNAFPPQRQQPQQHPQGPGPQRPPQGPPPQRPVQEAYGNPDEIPF